MMNLLCVVADRQSLKRGNGHLAYCARIGIGFAPDNDFRIHVLRVPFFLLANGEVTGGG